MDGQLKAGTFLTSESSNKYKVISLLGAGGQGEVYDVAITKDVRIDFGQMTGEFK